MKTPDDAMPMRNSIEKPPKVGIVGDRIATAKRTRPKGVKSASGRKLQTVCRQKIKEPVKPFVTDENSQVNNAPECSGKASVLETKAI